MSSQNVAIVFRKELRETLRDRRTLISSILVPILAFPLLMFGFGGLAFLLATRAVRESPTVMLLGEEHAPTLAARLRKDKELTVVPPAGDYVKQINDKKLRAAVEFPPGFEQGVEQRADESQIVKVYHYEGELRSSGVVRGVERNVRAYADEVVSTRLAARGLPPGATTPFKSEKKNVASAEKVTGNILGMILPYFIIVLCLTGAMYPAMDLTAGEKERGTMETILASPASRVELVLGKFFLVLAVSLVTAALSVVSFASTLLGGAQMMRSVTRGLMVAVSGKAVAAVFLLVLPLAIFFAAGLLAVSILARSYREAQTYLGPMIIVVILPAMASFLPGVELNARLALVPILNVSLVAKEVFAGNYPWRMIGLIFGSTSVYAAAALGVAVWQFHREEVLFRT